MASTSQRCRINGIGDSVERFRHVGLEKVETEWRWACLTLNLKKILSVLSRLRRLAREALSEAALDV
jgi:hypothetical protein